MNIKRDKTYQARMDGLKYIFEKTYESIKIFQEEKEQAWE